MRLLYTVMLLAGLAMCAYAIHCALHMREYIGTPEYWSNIWFWKAHAALFAIAALYLAAPWVKGKTGK